MGKNKTLKITLSGVALTSIGLSGYYTFYKPEQTNNNSTTSNQNTTQQTTTNTTSNVQTTQNSTLKDGTFTGEVIHTRRGDVHLSITVSGGKITAITPLIYPNEDSESKQINTNAIPKYTKEALEKQNSQISLISGATETFNGFTGSLQDAINKSLQS